MAAAKPTQFTFDPGDKGKRVGMDLFDEEGKPVDLLVTVLACDDEQDEPSMATTGAKRKIVLSPGGFVVVEGLRDDEHRPRRVFLYAKACPETGGGGKGGENVEETEVPRVPSHTDVVDLVADDTYEAPDVGAPEGLSDDAEM